MRLPAQSPGKKSREARGEAGPETFARRLVPGQAVIPATGIISGVEVDTRFGAMGKGGEKIRSLFAAGRFFAQRMIL